MLCKAGPYDGMTNDFFKKIEIYYQTLTNPVKRRKIIVKMVLSCTHDEVEVWFCNRLIH